MGPVALAQDIVNVAFHHEFLGFLFLILFGTFAELVGSPRLSVRDKDSLVLCLRADE